MVIIRAEQPADIPAIARVNELAFGRKNEGKLVDLIRHSEHFIPELSLVAEENGEIAGHILFSSAMIEREGSVQPMITLAPMAVVPGQQGKGIGSQLVREGLRVCRELGHPLVVVLGHSTFYPKFGFVISKEKGIHPPFPVPDDVFMVCELEEGAAARFQGTVQYPPAFGAV
ncbi:GNAT family N-acetyltransferase [Ectobacillus ponti]|uniref:N-acetyltransferase n=1 Tax=Ectobacillus ponti TaxID=2961894 RepID=A0AA41X874_9BACI|nr:N-acetyltransferase [Ectobacillus ponti]MCP8970592.1 N-acetyltransferase [Ectobacillus ponti]